jgi:hypothetical protein
MASSEIKNHGTPHTASGIVFDSSAEEQSQDAVVTWWFVRQDMHLYQWGTDRLNPQHDKCLHCSKD